MLRQILGVTKLVEIVLDLKLLKIWYFRWLKHTKFQGVLNIKNEIILLVFIVSFKYVAYIGSVVLYFWTVRWGAEMPPTSSPRNSRHLRKKSNCPVIKNIAANFFNGEIYMLDIKNICSIRSAQYEKIFAR